MPEQLTTDQWGDKIDEYLVLSADIADKTARRKELEADLRRAGFRVPGMSARGERKRRSDAAGKARKSNGAPQ